ncbi:MAG TPA: hypothetical protein VMM79_21035 [Longimicrobiales bacterium]|nr:hypothetical protein [Longimicrobiales bacterium]
MNGIALSPHDRAELVAHVQAVYPRAAAGYLLGHEDSNVVIVQRTVRCPALPHVLHEGAHYPFCPVAERNLGQTVRDRDWRVVGVYRVTSWQAASAEAAKRALEPLQSRTAILVAARDHAFGSMAGLVNSGSATRDVAFDLHAWHVPRTGADPAALVLMDGEPTDRPAQCPE